MEYINFKSIVTIAFIILMSQTELLAQNGKLYQAGYNGNVYLFGFNSDETISIIGAPSDTDWNRWSILHDGSVYRLYFMAIGKSNILYQFGYNPFSGDYEYGYESKPIIEIAGLPNNANVTGFSILFDGSYYRLYFKSSNNYSLYQCAYDFSSQKYRFGYESIPEIKIKNAPSDVDLRSWSMLYDGEAYRLYFKSISKDNYLYQFGFNGISYEYGYNSTPVIKVEGMPFRNYTKKFNITFDGSDYRYYNLEVVN
jgi:hypothetical protein